MILCNFELILMIMSGATALFTVWEEMGPGIELGPSKNLHQVLNSNQIGSQKLLQ